MSSTSFWLVCDSPNENCHCDWRVELEGCREREIMHYIYLSNTIWTAIVLLLGLKLVYTRFIVRKRKIFERSHSNSIFFRPKPIESLIFFGAIFNVLRLIDSAILTADTIKNVYFRAVLYEIPWQFGICSFSCYLFGIAYTVSNSSKVIRNNWFKSTRLIDIMCVVLITLPFISNNICSVFAAVYAVRGDFEKAAMFTQALYYMWTIYCFLLGTLIFFAGLRLLKVLSLHLSNQEQSGINVVKLKSAIFKLKVIIVVGVVCLYVFAIIKCMYGTYRHEILYKTPLNILVAVIWSFDGTAASMFVVVVLLINPNALTGFAFSTTSLGSGTDHNFSRSKWTDSATPISSNNINGEKIMPRPSGQFKVYNHPQGYPMEQYPYIVPEPEQPNTPVQSSTRDTISTASSVTSNCLLDQQNYYSVTASKGRSIPSPVPVPPAGSGFTNNYYYDETEISKAHLVTHQSNGYNR